MADDPQPTVPGQPPIASAPAASDSASLEAVTLPDSGLGVALAPGARPLPDYELVKLLGRGGFGEVWRAAGPGGFDIALKFIRLGGPAAQVELRSLELIKGIRHPHLLTMFGAWLRRDYLIVAMELADRTLLQRWQECSDQGMPGIPAPELLEYIREAAEGLDFLNEVRHPSASGGLTGVQHKDVKPQNLLLVGGAVKVADFGLAQVLEQTSVSASGGLTPAYAAPEFFQGRTSRWSDQYSLAVTYCHLRGGRLPFTGSAARVMASHVSQPPDLDMIPESERGAVERTWPRSRGAAGPVAGRLPTLWRPVYTIRLRRDRGLMRPRRRIRSRPRLASTNSSTLWPRPIRRRSSCTPGSCDGCCSPNFRCRTCSPRCRTKTAGSSTARPCSATSTRTILASNPIACCRRPSSCWPGQERSRCRPWGATASCCATGGCCFIPAFMSLCGAGTKKAG